ncbi:hypothetical protein BU25DRAFT_445323 [Macroventuria anomochaeta]|uniref:Uncharacterized protein n=1 Tax=Macroventuria anomochaeta TaxID=301207 RepID=A0ACB6SD41_9PLEO|nr:uncharacterized protein BU25DRAFT_445323 [Macroventuria anomochaeta]KAF2632220.1 hypothetical protein BU25DRAFT_445323 [Macroventuria anomochaeta]
MVTDICRLTSTKHHTVECSTQHREPTFVSHTSKTQSITRPSDSKISATPLDTEPFVSEQRIDAGPSPALSRHKSIRQRLGRFFLHFTRAHPEPFPNAYEYRHSEDASELPAGGTPIEGSATVQEMPAPFANQGTFELEQPQLYDICSYSHTMNSACDGNSTNFHQSYCKPTCMDELAMFRGPLQVATPKHLPRLAVPGSMHSLPAMIADQSPNSASSISPNTPVGHFNNGIQPYWNLQPATPTISPCEVTSTLPWYDRPSSRHYHTQRNFESPMTPSSAGSFNVATPLSAHPSSAHAPFGAWPEPGPEYLRSAFPQRCQPMNYESNTHSTPNLHQSTWMADVDPRQYRHHNQPIEVRNQATVSDMILSPGPQCNPPNYGVPSAKEKSLYSESQLLPAIDSHDTTTRICHRSDYAPPAYTSITAYPSQYPPATCQHCGKSYTGKFAKGNLKRHVQQIHQSFMDRAIHLCRICMKTYNRADALRKHQWKKHRQEDARPNKRRKQKAGLELKA